MARPAVFALLLGALLSTLLFPQGVHPKSTASPPKPDADDDFSLEDAVIKGEDNDPVPPSPPKPRPDPHPASSDGFSDVDLVDQTSGGGGGGGNQRNDGEAQGEAQGVVPGIIGAVVVAVAGAISSFIAYQKKKLCFKENADEGTVYMETNRTTNTEPLVQQTIIQK